jgi:ABC-type multidrug transport system permease subunit
MVRVLLMATAISFVVGVFLFMRKEAVAARSGVALIVAVSGGLSGRNANCMPRCVEACQAKHKSK